MRRDGGPVFPALAKTGDPNGPLEAWPLRRNSLARTAQQAPKPGQTHGSGGERLDLYSVAKIGQTFDQTFLLLVGRVAIEVIAAEVLVHRPVLEHVVDGGKDGGDDGHDRLLGAAPRFDAIELSLQVAVFLFDRGPGALHHRGFEPGTALAH